MKFTIVHCRLILEQFLVVNGTLINRQNNTHIEYCRHIDITFLLSRLGGDIITLQHHTSLLGSTQGEQSYEKIAPPKTPMEATITSASAFEGLADPFGPKARRRRSLNNCDDACYEISLMHFEISFDMEMSNFTIKNEDRLIFNKTLNNFDVMMIGQEVEIEFHANENFFVDVSKMRYESIPPQYSTLPKRNIKNHSVLPFRIALNLKIVNPYF